MVPGQAIVFSSPKTKRKALRLLGVPRPLASAGGPLPPTRGKQTKAAHGHEVLPEDANAGGVAPAGLHGIYGTTERGSLSQSGGENASLWVARSGAAVLRPGAPRPGAGSGLTACATAW